MFENKVAVAAAALTDRPSRCSHSNFIFANVVKPMVLATFSVDVTPELGRVSGTSLTKRQNPIVQALFGQNLRKIIILECFMQNGLQHRNQRIFSRMKSCVKIDFRHFWFEVSTFNIKIIKN